MIQDNAILVVDLGNSSTKGKVLFGKDAKTNKFRKRGFEIPNIFSSIDEDYEVPNDYSDVNSTILKVDTMVDGLHLVGNYCNGEIQTREKALSSIKPTANAKKWTLDSTALSLRLAFLFAYKILKNIKKAGEFSQLDISWKVVALLPPRDVDAGREPLTAMIKDITKLEAVFPEVSVNVNITDVLILPEGFCAYAGVVYDIGHVYRPDYKYLLTSTVLVIDIGAGTTDFILIQDNKQVRNSRYTVDQGGNNVFRYVKRKLVSNDIRITDEALREGILTGKIKDGAKEVSIVDIINSAKDEVSQKLVSEFNDFVESADIAIRSIEYVLVCGGGAMAANNGSGINALSDRVVVNLKRLAPNIELIKIPAHVIAKELPDGDTEKVEEPISPRDLNILGASILAELF